MDTADTLPIPWSYNCIDTRIILIYEYKNIREVFITDDTEYTDLFADHRKNGFTSDLRRFSEPQKLGIKQAVNGGIVHG